MTKSKLCFKIVSSNFFSENRGARVELQSVEFFGFFFSVIQARNGDGSHFGGCSRSSEIQANPGYFGC